MTAIVHQDDVISGLLPAALAHCRLYPVFQPLVRLSDRSLAGFEVLARWSEPGLGDIPPSDFIPAAERSCAIWDLSSSIIRQACAAAVKWPGDFTLAVNVSPEQMQDMRLPVMLDTIAADTGFPLNRLEVEVTENALLGDVRAAQRVAEAIKERGCTLALDDFGIGYASLRRLQSLPFDKIKIDLSFVRSMIDKRESRKIVASVVGLGQSLGIAVLAEGVETESHLEILERLDCTYGQGWLFGKGMPANEAQALAEAHSQSDHNRAFASSTILNLSPNQRLAQLEAIYDSVPVGLAFIDTSLRYVSVNERYASLWGTTAAEIVGCAIPDLAPDIDSRYVDPIKRLLRGEEVAMDEVRHPSGRYIMASGRTVRDEAGEILGVSLALTDVTERKIIGEALIESEENYRFTVELSPQANWIAEPDGSFPYISAKYQTLVGRTLEQLQGSGWADIIHPDDRQMAWESWSQAMRTGEIHDQRFRVLTVDGTYHITRCYAAPRLDENGNVVRWYGTVEDVTDPLMMTPASRMMRKH